MQLSLLVIASERSDSLWKTLIHMLKQFSKLLVGSVVVILSIGQNSWAETVECKRTSDDSTGWKSSTFFNEIWPKKLSLKKSEFYEAGNGSEAMLLAINYPGGWTQTIRLLPNKKAVGSFVVPARYEQPAIVRYICDLSSNHLRVLVQREQRENETTQRKNVEELTLTDPEMKLDEYQKYRKVTFNDSKTTQQTFVAYNSVMNGEVNLSKGKVFVSGEWCTVTAKFHIKTKDSKFSVNCPSDYFIKGTFEVLGSGKGEIGTGKDSFGNTVQYKLHPTTGKFLVSRQDFLNWVQANTFNSGQKQKMISSDTKLPTITIASATNKGAQGIIRGRVNDNTGIAELRIDGQNIAVDSNGNFSATTYVPEGGTSVNIEAIDLAGLSSTISVRVDRATTQTASISFDRLNPLKRKAAINNDALALVIGVSNYKETNAKAIYADSDAKVFQDYAIEKLGVPRGRVKTLLNDGADEKDMLLATKRWLARAAKQGKTDIYIFFAGHGLASDDGSKMYLLPYDGAPELLDDTAILRDRLFSDIAAANPRSVTVFLDTCYSGTTRGTDMLIASRPIAIRALEQSIPDNFTVMTAAAGDQTAKPLEEAKHGMFSYFLMKGMEGEADANSDNEITAGELHSYVQTNVIQQSSGSQTPELQGDADRVLVRFE